MQFVFQSLTWGFLLVLLPLLIHLINLLRYRRQRWAAMQFLLESYKRHRRWVWLKQALLLLSRMAILAVLVALLAQWVSNSRLLALLGQSSTHHYVLLDDSMSMGQSFRDGTIYERGIRSLANILDRSVQDGGSHQVSVMRFSRAALQNKSPDNLDDSTSRADAIADVLSRTLLGKADELLSPIAASGVVDVDVDGNSAVQLLNTLIANADTSENPIVYYVSDFREKEWAQPGAIKSSLQSLEKYGCQFELIDCADANVENLSLLSLQPDQEVLAAGVPVLLRLTLQNRGTNPIRNLTVNVTGFDFHDQNLNIAFDQFSSGQAIELPAIAIEKIDPQETITRSVQVVFPESGSHVVAARIADDSLRSDNFAACVMNLVDYQRLLLVDDTADRTASRYMQAALDPSGTAKTGWKVQTESSAYLRDTQPELLSDFAAIVLTDVSALDERAVRNLRNYVYQGGGLALFPGRQWTLADAQRILNSLNVTLPESLANADIASAPLIPLRALEVKSLQTSTPEQLTVEQHPIFSPLLSLAASPFQFVRFTKFLDVAPVEQSEANANRPIEIAHIGTKTPLLLEHTYGSGRVIIGTVAIDPAWTSWAQDPTFVVVSLKLAGYLASHRRTPTSTPITSPLQYTFSAQEYLPQTELVLATRNGASKQSIQVNAVAKNEQTLALTWSPLESTSSDSDERNLYAGTRELWLTSLSGGRRVINFATNAPSKEGDLLHSSQADILESLRPLKVTYRTVETAVNTNPFAGNSTQQTWLFGLLIALLLIEQALAYLASYHLPKKPTVTGVPT